MISKVQSRGRFTCLKLLVSHLHPLHKAHTVHCGWNSYGWVRQQLWSFLLHSFPGMFIPILDLYQSHRLFLKLRTQFLIGTPCALESLVSTLGISWTQFNIYTDSYLLCDKCIDSIYTGGLMGHSKMQGYFISPFRIQNLSTSSGIYNLTFLYTHLTNRSENGYAGNWGLL